MYLIADLRRRRVLDGMEARVALIGAPCRPLEANHL